MADHPEVYFYHIPKTGGGSVSVMLHECKTPARRNVYRHAVNWHSAHTKWQRGRAEIPEGAKAITWLRDPVSITYSAYSYFTDRMDVRKNDIPRPAGDPVAEFVWDIRQAKSLEAYINETEFPYPYGWWPPDLRQFDYIGVTELMEKSIAGLGCMLGLDIPYNPELRNTSTYDRQDRPGERRLIELFNKERAEWQTRYNQLTDE